MPISFSTMPSHLQQQCLNKLDFDDFHRFWKSSPSSWKIAKLAEKRFTIKKQFLIVEPDLETPFKIYSSSCLYMKEDFLSEMTAVPIQMKIDRFSINGDSLSDLMCKQMIPVFEKGWTCEIIQFPPTADCSTDLFRKLLHFSKVQNIQTPYMYTTNIFFPSKYLLLPEIQQLSTIYLASHINDAELLTIKAPNMQLNTENLITSEGMNAVLQEWNEGKRNIQRWRINGKFPKEKDDILLKGLNAERVYKTAPRVYDGGKRYYEISIEHISKDLKVSLNVTETDLAIDVEERRIAEYAFGL